MMPFYIYKTSNTGIDWYIINLRETLIYRYHCNLHSGMVTSF